MLDCIVAAKFLQMNFPQIIMLLYLKCKLFPKPVEICRKSQVKGASKVKPLEGGKEQQATRPIGFSGKA